MTEEEQQDKPHEATPRKLERAREKGEIPRSRDTLAAAAYLGLLGVAFTVGGAVMSRTGTLLSALLAHAGQAGLHGAGGATVASALIGLAGPLGILLGLPTLVVAAVITAERGWVFAPQKIAPKLNRISPLSNGKQKFGRNGLFDFAKSAVKMLVIASGFALFLRGRLTDILSTAALDARAVSALALLHARDFLVLVAGLAVVIAIIDYFWQHAEHMRRQRMTRKELTDEAKEAEGDPWVKQQRRQRGYDIATNRMLGDVPKADVVIVNPLHYAVALRWDRTAGGAPVCVAKGTDEIAHRIRTIAIENGVPIRHDPPTARALHAAVKIGAEIPPEHYRPVAAAIRFADAMRRRARDVRSR